MIQSSIGPEAAIAEGGGGCVDAGSGMAGDVAPTGGALIASERIEHRPYPARR